MKTINMKSNLLKSAVLFLSVVLMLSLAISCKNDKLNLSAKSIELNFPAGEAEVGITANIPWSIVCDANWCYIKNGVGENDGTFTILTDMNETQEDRIAWVIITGNNELKDSLSITQKAISITDENFYFDQTSYTFSDAAETSTIDLVCPSGWKLEPDSKPAWLKVTPSSGKGNASIEISSDKNKLLLMRKANLIFTNEQTKDCISLRIEQMPTVVKGMKDYSYLGLGYDAAGQYAHSSETKATILDWNKLADKNYINPVLTDSELKGRSIYGKTIQEYQKKLGTAAGVGANYKGFSASINMSFNKENISAEENEFITIYQHSPQAIIKLSDNIQIKDLRLCLTNEATEDINGTMAAIDVIKKYGTHVVTGFILGGTMNYSLTADMSFSSGNTDWEAAAKAGYKSMGGGGDVSGSVTEYQKVTTQGVNVKETIDARGGDAQLASIKGNYSKWLESLNNPDKWVMIDYAGNGLLEIADLALTSKRQNELRKAIANHLRGDLPSSVSTHKQLQITFQSANFTGNAGASARDIYPVFENGEVIVNGKSYDFIRYIKLQLPDKTDKDKCGKRYPSDDIKDATFGRGNGRSDIIDLSMKKENTIKVSFKMTKNKSEYESFVLKYNPQTDTWREEGTNNYYSNGGVVRHTIGLQKERHDIREAGNLNTYFEISWK